MKKPIIAITMGDPGGIGPEVILRCFPKLKKRGRCLYLLIGTPAPFQFLARYLGSKVRLNPVPSADPSVLKTDVLNFLDVSREARKIGGFAAGKRGMLGFDKAKVSKRNAAAAYTSLAVAARLAAAGKVDALVTAPVNKTSMRLVNRNFQGHTEYLAEASGTKKFAMLFTGKRLRVTLVTIHTALKNVSRMLTPAMILDKILLTHEFLKSSCGIPKPKLAVCALNPHGSETGKEEARFILPAIRRARARRILAEGPLPGDQVFYEAYHGRYDAVISMYHDQGLAPFKLTAFRDGVNVTLGLPFIRTSPDHGTAFDIAYRGEADAESMRAAVDLAGDLLTKK